MLIDLHNVAVHNVKIDCLVSLVDKDKQLTTNPSYASIIILVLMAKYFSLCPGGPLVWRQAVLGPHLDLKQVAVECEIDNPHGAIAPTTTNDPQVT